MDIISDVLGLLKLKSTIYFRTEFYNPWGICVPAYENVARFHFVHRGRCWLTVGNSDAKIPLHQGDLAIIPHGIEHVICDPVDAEIKSLEHATSAYAGEGTLVYGNEGNKHLGNDTQLVCGHWSFEKDASHPLISMLPNHIHIEYSKTSGTWLEHTLKMIGVETEINRPGHEQVTIKLSESILVYAIRDYLISSDTDIPFYNAMRDERILKVLQALHANPSKTWTLNSMCNTANLSRTSFANRFVDLVGMTPLQYLTYWRMQLSRRLLIESNNPIIDIAENIGYQSEVAFGRSFKKFFTISPAEYRRNYRERSKNK